MFCSHDITTQEVCLAATVTGVQEDRGNLSLVTEQSRSRGLCPDIA